MASTVKTGLLVTDGALVIDAAAVTDAALVTDVVEVTPAILRSVRSRLTTRQWLFCHPRIDD